MGPRRAPRIASSDDDLYSEGSDEDLPSSRPKPAPPPTTSTGTGPLRIRVKASSSSSSPASAAQPAPHPPPHHPNSSTANPGAAALKRLHFRKAAPVVVSSAATSEVDDESSDDEEEDEEEEDEEEDAAAVGYDEEDAEGEEEEEDMLISSASSDAVQPAHHHPTIPASRAVSGRKRAKPVYEDDDDWLSGDDTGTGTAPPGAMTARQRAREFGEPLEELQSLPMKQASTVKKKERTEADKALERAEKSRRRKHQSEQKLEDEKTETINRLLKKQVGKSAGRQVLNADKKASSRTSGASTPLPLSAAAAAAAAAHGTPLNADGRPINVFAGPMLRYLSTVKTGEFALALSVPTNSTAKLDHLAPVAYPGPRPPPKTRRLR